MRNIIKLFLIFSAIMLRYDSIIERVLSFGISLNFFIYILMLIGSCILLMITGWIIDWRLRIFWAILLSVASIPVIGIESAEGGQMAYLQFITFVDASSSIADALRMYPTSVAVSLLSVTLLLFGIGLAPIPHAAVSSRLAFSAPLIGTILISATMIIRDSGGSGGIPASWAGVGYVALYVKDSRIGIVGTRQPVRIMQTQQAIDRDIVVIVDESVAGQYLDINSPTGVESGLARLPDNIVATNFGLAISAAHCSMNSNITLRYGGTRTNYQRIIGTLPSIWSYAKTAGYHTAYLYAQRGGVNENYMTDVERQNIDESFYFDDVAPVDRDQQVAHRLSQLMNDNKSDFILVNKMGAHFPVHASYPISYTQYAPTLSRDLYWKIGDQNLEHRLNILGPNRDWRRYRNSYRNTIRWTVGAFFRTLFSESDLSKATIIYTSDHGQTFHERGTSGVTTHCRTDPDIEEFVVPLVVIDASKNANPKFNDAAKLHANARSHYQIFPTLLKLMGFDPVAVRKTYGESLDSERPDPMTYAPHVHLWLNHETIWKHLDMSKIVQPSISDFQHE